jgi:hypothetical protein
VTLFIDMHRNMQKLVSLLANVKRLLRNVFLDLRYGAFLGGIRKTPYGQLGIQDTASTDYAALPYIFAGAIKESDVLVDIGCGKGRVINWWLSRGLRNPIIGIELDGIVADRTQKRLRRCNNVKIICGNALMQLPEDGTMFYLFNPFDREWVSAFKDRLSMLFVQGDNKTVYYYNCVHVDVFEDDPNWVVEKLVLDPSRFHPLAVIRRRH